ncbi:acyl-CoA dehydrogenase/oxidase C-terminal [Aspergillus californicus]
MQFRSFLPAVLGGRGCVYDYELGDDGDLVKVFQLRATALAYDVYQERVVKKNPWTSLMVQFHKLSNAQSQSILITNFYNALASSKDIPLSTRAGLWDLYRLFATFTIVQDRYEFFTCNAASQTQLDALPQRINELMARIRPQAVSLVDAWKIPDYLLDSALGRYDGRVYEDLFNRAHRLNPLNGLTVNPNYWEDEIFKGGEDLKGVLSKL